MLSMLCIAFSMVFESCNGLKSLELLPLMVAMTK